jgi:hypothetical protein
MSQASIRSRLEDLLRGYQRMLAELDQFCGEAPVETWGRGEENRLADHLDATRQQGAELARLLNEAGPDHESSSELRQLQLRIAATMEQVVDRTRQMETRMQAAIDYRQRFAHHDVMARRMREAYRPVSQPG